METVLESGSLPVSFEYAQSQVVGPTLGQDALTSGVLVAAHRSCAGHAVPAGVLPGSGPDHRGSHGCVRRAVPGHPGRCFRTSACSACRMAGIAGIVLTIGMAADSSILTLERFREEIRMGRSVRAASVTGVRHAILTSIDADLVTMVSALCAVLPGQRLGQGLRPDAGARHHLRHRHDAAVQGAHHPPAGAEVPSPSTPVSGA